MATTIAHPARKAVVGASGADFTDCPITALVEVRERSARVSEEFWLNGSIEGQSVSCSGAARPDERDVLTSRKTLRRRTERPTGSFHQLRRSRLLLVGAGIEVVRMLVGHADLSTTQRYVHVNGADSVVAVHPHQCNLSCAQLPSHLRKLLFSFYV